MRFLVSVLYWQVASESQQKKLTKMLDIRTTNVTPKCLLWNGHPAKTHATSKSGDLQRPTIKTTPALRYQLRYQALWPLLGATKWVPPFPTRALGSVLQPSRSRVSGPASAQIVTAIAHPS